MPTITLTATFSPTDAKIWSSDPVFGNGSRHQITATFQAPGGSNILPAHTYMAGTMAVQWHVAPPYTNFWNYYMKLRVDANPQRNPFSLSNGAHAWSQSPNQPNSGPGTALEDDFTLPGVWISAVNAAAGSTFTVLLNLDGTIQVPNSTTIVIDSVTLNLTYADTPGSNFAKKWSAALVDGQALCTFVYTSGALQVSTTRSIKGGLTAGKGAGWTTPYQIAAHAQDCNVGIHPGKGRGQIWYTQLDASGNNPASVFTTSVTAGANQDWSAATTITPRTSYTLSNLMQPYSPIYNSGNGTYKYVVSQSSGTGLDVGVPGPDARLYWYPSTAYTIYQGGGMVIANGFCNKDNGLGATWDWRDLNGSGPFNSEDGAPLMIARDSDSGYPGKTYGIVVGNLPHKSAVVRADDGTLYQLIFTTSYARLAKVVPRVGTSTADPGGNLWQNNVNNQSPTTNTATTQYTLSVPSGTDQIHYIRFNWQETTRERASVVGIMDNPNHPTTLRFDIPALADIPPYNDLGQPNSPYGGSSHLSAYVEWDVVYKDAVNLQIALTHDLRQGQQGQKYPLAQQAKTPLINGRGEFTGAAGWDYYGEFDIDRSRQSTMIFDVLISGQYDWINIKSAKLHIHNIQTETIGDTMTLSSAQAATTTTPLTLGYGGSGGEIHVDFAYPPPAGQQNYTPVNASLLDEINSRRGNDWNFDLTWTQHNGLGAGGSDKLLPFDTLFRDQYAQCYYQANQTDGTKADFFLVRSRDNGRSFEYAANGKPISQLNVLRDANNLGVDVKMPSLVTEDNVVHCIYVESSVVKTVSSQDAGATWQSL